MVISHQVMQRASRNKYDDDVVGARRLGRLEGGGASKLVASSLREAPARLIATATESLGGLNYRGCCMADYIRYSV